MDVAAVPTEIAHNILPSFLHVPRLTIAVTGKDDINDTSIWEIVCLPGIVVHTVERPPQHGPMYYMHTH